MRVNLGLFFGSYLLANVCLLFSTKMGLWGYEAFQQEDIKRDFQPQAHTA